MGFNWSKLIEEREKYTKELDIRLKTISISLEVVEKEINGLTTTVEVLQADLKFLKQECAVISTWEFRKNKEELAKTVNRLNLLIGDRFKILRALKIMKNLVDDNNLEYDLLLQRSRNVIVSGRFGEKKDG